MARRAALVMLLCACQGRGNQAAPNDVVERAPTTATPARATRPEVSGTSSSALAPSVPASEHTWSFPDTPFGRIDVVIRVPAHAPGTRLPLLIAFHGRGESLKGPARGARGWLDDYRLERAAERLSRPPLEKDDFGGFVTAQRLEMKNRELALAPFRDLVVVMPYLPDVLARGAAFENGPVLSEFVVETLLPRLHRELPVAPEPARTGIDGVSLGGRAALLVAFTAPERFGSVGATQPAIDQNELTRWVALAAEARRKNPALSLRLLTSHDDYYREVVGDYARELRAASVVHQFDVVSGNHSYAFNRGPGAIEMLLHHSRQLWR